MLLQKRKDLFVVAYVEEISVEMYMHFMYVK